MIKVIDSYVVKSLITAYGICLASVLSVYAIVDTLTHMDEFLGKESFFAELGSYFLSSIPVVYYHIAPGTFLMAAMFTLSSLNRHNELLALRASGVSIYRVLQPIVVASFVAALLMATVQEVIIPSQAESIRRTYRDRPVKKVLICDTGGNIFRIDRYFPYDKRMEGVVITTFYPEGTKHLSIQAASADYAENGWRLKDVRLYEHDENGMLKVAVDKERGLRLPYVKLDAMSFRTDIMPSDIESVDRDVNFLTFRQLNAQYHRQNYLPHLRVKLHSRIAFPLANFVLLLLGVPFALTAGRRALLLNVTVCIALASAFFVVTFFLAELGADGKISPIAAAWLPIVIFTALGLACVETIQT